MVTVQSAGSLSMFSRHNAPLPAPSSKTLAPDSTGN